MNKAAGFGTGVRFSLMAILAFVPVLWVLENDRTALLANPGLKSVPAHLERSLDRTTWSNVRDIGALLSGITLSGL